MEESDLLVQHDIQEATLHARPWAIPRWKTLASLSLLVGGLICLSTQSARAPVGTTTDSQPAALYASRCIACGDVLQCGNEKWQLGQEQGTANGSLKTLTVTAEAFTCRGGCVISAEQRNDNACHCPLCEDEDSWSCETCGADILRSLGGSNEGYYIPPDHYARDVGVGVGVGLSSALALGFGLAFGLDTDSDKARSLGLAAYTYYLVIVQLKLRVFANLPFRENRLLRRVLRKAMARLSGATSSMVALRFPASDDNDDDDGGRRLGGLRRLEQTLKVDVGIRFQDSARAARATEQLQQETASSAQTVMESELSSAGVPGQVEVVKWEPAPNPRAYSPNLGPVDGGEFHFDDGVSLGGN